MLKVLINAYACSPDMGSEPGMAWNWCVSLAKHCELHIITEGEFRERIEAAVPTLPQGERMHFYYNPVPQRVRDMCWNQGDWRFYWYYRKWQKRTLSIAQKICEEQQIDIIHQLNMIGYREPGLLWRIKGPRYVWGPFGGLTMLPVSYLRGAGWKQRLFCLVKNVINALQYRYQPNVRAAVKRADVLIAATSEAQRRMEGYYHKKVYLINETGCEVAGGIPEERQDNCFRLLWVGKFDFRKQLDMALEVLSKLQTNDIELHICGRGTDEQTRALKKKVIGMGIERRVVFHGLVTHNEVQHLMQTSSLLLFTSISEGTPHVVLEAIANRLPVVCFDCCGQGDIVTNEIGRKIPVTTPEESVTIMAQAIKELYNHRDVLSQLSYNCIAASKRMSWDEKSLELTDIYTKLPPPHLRLRGWDV